MKYALSHCFGILIAALLIITFATVFISDTVSQLNSAKNGIEILFVDVTLSSGSTSQLANEIKKRTGVKYVGIATLESSSAEEYIRTVENYSMADYLEYLTRSRDSELIIITGSMLETAMQMDNVIPYSATFAVPLTGIELTSYGTKAEAIEDVYALLIDGDHIDAIRSYIDSLFGGEHV